MMKKSVLFNFFQNKSIFFHFFVKNVDFVWKKIIASNTVDIFFEKKEDEFLNFSCLSKNFVSKTENKIKIKVFFQRIDNNYHLFKVKKSKSFSLFAAETFFSQRGPKCFPRIYCRNFSLKQQKKSSVWRFMFQMPKWGSSFC